MKALWIIPLLWLPQEKPKEPAHRRIVDLKITGMTSNACYEIVSRFVAKAKGADRAIFWVSKGAVRTHIVVKGDLRLTDVEAALTAARQEMKETLRMEVDYKIDVAVLKLPAGTKIIIDDKESKVEKETTLAELRKTVKVADVVLPAIDHPVCAFACPNACAASDEKGRCPKCNEEYLPVAPPKADGG